MPVEEKELFEATRPANGGRVETVKVLMWANYGIVAPGWWTTNGSAAYTASCLIMGQWVLPEEWRCDTHSELVQKLVGAYRAWMAEIKKA